MSIVRCTDEKPNPALGTGLRECDLHSQRKRLIGYAVFAALLGLAFLNPLVTLAIYAAGTDIHSHVLLIPFISAYLIYLRRNELPKSYQSSLGPASLLLIVGSSAFLVSWNLQRSDPPIHPGDYFSLIAFSFVSLLTAGGFLFLGRKWMAAAAFPIAFLTFMIPLPDRMLNWLETVSQLASAEMAALFFTVTGVPMLREGTIFSLPGIVIAVAQECSGIRSSCVLFITTLAASYLFLKSPWRRGVLMAFVIPLQLCAMAVASG